MRQRSLAGYGPWGHKELDTTEQLKLPLIFKHSNAQTWSLTSSNSLPSVYEGKWRSMSIFTSVDNEEATPGSMVSLRAGRSKWGDIQYRSERTSSWRWHLKITIKKGWGELPGGPLANSLASNAGDAGSIPGWGSKLAYTAEQLSPCATTREPTCCKYWSPNALGPMRCKERPRMMQPSMCCNWDSTQPNKWINGEWGKCADRGKEQWNPGGKLYVIFRGEGSISVAEASSCLCLLDGANRARKFKWLIKVTGLTLALECITPCCLHCTTHLPSLSGSLPHKDLHLWFLFSYYSCLLPEWDRMSLKWEAKRNETSQLRAKTPYVF